jgi:CMP-N,N'-diacetyllegionaminic acid synthase
VYNGHRVLAIVPARGGSKGLPGKNIAALGGKPLIVWTIEAATKSAYIDRLILSSDDDSIIQVALDHGCDVPFRRPDDLAGDETSTVEAVRHTLMELDESYDYIVLLQPTSPLRNTNDIDFCISRCIDSNSATATTLSVNKKPVDWSYYLSKDGRLAPVLDHNKRPDQRQQATDSYSLNGAVYVASAQYIESNDQFVNQDTYGCPMPTRRSIDIDDECDLIFAEALVQAHIAKRVDLNIQDRIL